MEAALKILVVDDDATARLLMRAALQKAGFLVTVADCGEDALRQFRGDVFNMVMLDVHMPDMSGFEVCVAMRAQAGDLLPIVMVTGMDDVESVEKAYDSGATDFISKPINWALIGHRVKYLLRGYQAFLDLRSADARNAAVLKAIPDMLFELDVDGRCIDVHSPRTDFMAAPMKNLIGRTVADALPPEAAEMCMSALRAAHESGSSSGKQFELKLPRGTYWFELSVSRKADESAERPHFIVLSRDITERKEAERRIIRLAYFDTLTGLPNRQSFLDRVDREIRRARYSGNKFAVLFMDFDRFKNINDTMGHNTGDLILQWAADRLREGVRPFDMVARANEGGDIELARLGGDEFTALILDLKQPGDAVGIAHRIRQLMRRPFLLDGREITITTSIGIALYPDDGEDAGALLKHADSAMYHAKDSGRDNCQFYSASLTEHAMKRLTLESDLRLALDRGEFSVAYQPLLHTGSERMHMVEALIRWKHPTQGMIPPMDFIPLTEETGLIIPINEWVLRTACTDVVAWQRQGHRIGLAVNVCPVQLKDPNLLQMFLSTLAQTGLDPELLELEITEGAMMEDTVATMATLKAFRDYGVSIALDDFGTGYSSLSYLKRMPLSRLKVDRSFVSGLPDDADSCAIVRAILAMADSLGLLVTAEGVETLDQAQTLKNMGCETLQGFYFSKAVFADFIPPLLTRTWSLSHPIPSLAAVSV